MSTETLLPTIIPNNLIEMSLLDAIAASDDERQREIIVLRRFYEGDQDTYLTERLKQFLGEDLEFNFNVLQTLISSITERMTVKTFNTSDADVASWAQEVWESNGLDAIQEDAYDGALRDGEYFAIVDWEGAPTITLHQRYTDTLIGGDGYGCWLIHPYNDINLPPSMGVKQWVEREPDGTSYERRNVYYPDVIRKYMRSTSIDWQWMEDVPWTGENGMPLGVPIIPFYNKGLRSEIWNALPLQRAANKVVIDTLSASDMTAFRIYYALGFVPTTDGEDPADDGSNLLKIEPGRIVGTTRPRGEVEFGAIDPAELTPLMQLVKSVLTMITIATNIPEGRLVPGGAPAEDSLVAKITRKQARFGNSWEQVMSIARRLNNAFGEGLTLLDEEVRFQTVWEEAAAQDEVQRIETLVLKRELGVPLVQLWREAGYNEQQITEMQGTEEYARLLEALGPAPNTTTGGTDEQPV